MAASYFVRFIVFMMMLMVPKSGLGIVQSDDFECCQIFEKIENI